MKRRLFTILVLCLLGPAVTFAAIEDNFKAGGIGIALSGYLYYNAGRMLDPANGAYSYQIALYPTLDFMVVDNLSVDITPSVTYSLLQYAPGRQAPNLNLGLSAGMTYYFVLGPRNPLVPSIGGSLLVTVVPGISGTYNYLPVEDHSLTVIPDLQLILGLNWFLTDRIAAYVALSPDAYVPFSLRDQSGNPIVDSTPLANRIVVNFRVSLGIRVFTPFKDQALFKQ